MTTCNDASELANSPPTNVIKNDDFDPRILEKGIDAGLGALSLDAVQVNIGLKCDLECEHCHVASSPRRTETMDWPTMAAVIDAAKRAGTRCVDITGGAPELNPNFKRFVAALCELNIDVMVRTNLTAFLEPGMENMPEFYRDHQVHLVASLPCYTEENVDKQRGHRVFERNVKALQLLNKLGYGQKPQLALDLVYNPGGPSLPPDQENLEKDYRRMLDKQFNLSFTRLLTITNMPIGRFRADLKRDGRLEAYETLLRDAFNPATLEGLMCRHQISVRWDGVLFDCDFNLALKMPACNEQGQSLHIRDFNPTTLLARHIQTGTHCFGCTAGCGSSCGGALA